MIPMPLGYINVGDSFVMLSGWSMGVWGAVGAALASAVGALLQASLSIVIAMCVVTALNHINVFRKYRPCCL